MSKPRPDANSIGMATLRMDMPGITMPGAATVDISTLGEIRQKPATTIDNFGKNTGIMQNLLV